MREQNNDEQNAWQEGILPRIEDVPPAVSGERGHDHTFKVACRIAQLCGGHGLERFTEWMREWNQGNEPPWSGGELDHKIEDAWAAVYSEETQAEVLPRAEKKKLRLGQVEEIAAGSAGMYEQLVTKGKEFPQPSLERIIDRMYPGNPLLCRAAGSEVWARTAPRSTIRGVEKEFEWLVPSPMSKPMGLNKYGQPSHRCRDNSGPRRYIVIEFDLDSRFKRLFPVWEKEGISTWDVQVALLTHLATTGEPRGWPFMIVNSGGKSLHSWYSIGKRFSEDNALDLLSRAIAWGADHRADQPEQFFRFPGGTRKSEKSQLQPILFYDQTKIVRP